MAKFKVGDKVRVVRFTSSDSVARTAAKDMIGVVKQDTLSGHGRISLEVSGQTQLVWARPADLELFVETAPSSEKMIPASKVREIAKLYAARHGWCDEVNNALREMGAEDDAMVEINVTTVRTIRLRRSDLDKLHTPASLEDVNYQSRLNAAFNGSAPDGATLQNFSFSKSEPVEVKPEADGNWVSAMSRTLNIDEEVRFEPGATRFTYNGRRVPEDVTMSLTNVQSDSDGDMRVRFSRALDGMHNYGYISRSKLQVNRPQG